MTAVSVSRLMILSCRVSLGPRTNRVFVYRFMKYSTAVYGDSMIAAAEMDVCGKFDSRSRLTRARISDHIGVPEEDIVLMDVEHGGDPHHLRHFVAIDHANRQVVLSIRGTFSFSEMVVDAAGFSSKISTCIIFCFFR